MPDHDHDDVDEHDRGLHHDLGRLLDRRRALQLLGGAAVFALLGACADDETAGGSSSTSTTGRSTSTSTTSGSGSSSTSSTSAASSASCEDIPTETAGPFPGDGSNGPNVLDQSGIVRSDLTSSFGSLRGTAAGVPLTIELTIQDAAKGCAPLAGAAVYLWHCDREGRYSLYSAGATDQNYLRGVQAAGADGRVRFTSIFPAAYSGRWPHIHFEVYPSLAKATTSTNKIATSQLALPEDVCTGVYATEGYAASVRNMAQTSLARDNVFRDGVDQQLATTTGNVRSGYTAGLVVPV